MQRHMYVNKDRTLDAVTILTTLEEAARLDTCLNGYGPAGLLIEAKALADEVAH